MVLLKRLNIVLSADIKYSHTVKFLYLEQWQVFSAFSTFPFIEDEPKMTSSLRYYGTCPLKRAFQMQWCPRFEVLLYYTATPSSLLAPLHVPIQSHKMGPICLYPRKILDI